MSYIAKLRALESEKTGTHSPTEPTKAPSVGFVGTPPATLRNISGAEAIALQARSREEQRRQRVLAMLEDSTSRYAVLGDDSDHQYPGRVVLAVAMRSEDGEIYSCELLIAADRYDGVRILELAEQNSRHTIH